MCVCDQIVTYLVIVLVSIAISVPCQSKDEPGGDKMDTTEVQKDGDNKMDTSDVKKDDKDDDDLDKGTAVTKPETKKDGDKKAAEPEPDFLMLSNPARVLPAQVSWRLIL